MLNFERIIGREIVDVETICAYPEAFREITKNLTLGGYVPYSILNTQKKKNGYIVLIQQFVLFG